jgi:[ribosomal protein S18]-alanine N-acetyltransferase
MDQSGIALNDAWRKSEGITVTYTFKPMTQSQAEFIAYNWQYEGEYSFYDMESDKEDLDEFLDPESRGETMFSVYEGEALVGFFSIIKTGAGIYDIGLGLRPELTGNGRGSKFLTAGMGYIKSHFSPVKITLSVARFNERAIKVYRRIGFQDAGTFQQDTNGGTYEFLKMEYVYHEVEGNCN